MKIHWMGLPVRCWVWPVQVWFTPVSALTLYVPVLLITDAHIMLTGFKSGEE